CTMIQVVTVAYVVFGRFVLNKTPKWGEEIALLAMVWLSLFSATLAIEDDSHIRISIFDKLFGSKGLIIRDSVFLVMDLTFCIFLIFEGTKLLFLTKTSVMPGSGLPVPIIYLAVPLASLAYSVALVSKFIEKVKLWTKIQ
ncbi:MAG: TRAP transporter small permease, partial [Sphaerochaetaceae bacterium]